MGFGENLPPPPPPTELDPIHEKNNAAEKLDASSVNLIKEEKDKALVNKAVENNPSLKKAKELLK